MGGRGPERRRTGLEDPWEEGATRAPPSRSRGRGARPGHLPGPLCAELWRARGGSPPGPGAVAARMPARASRGPGCAGKRRPTPASPPRPGAARRRRQGARASPPGPRAPASVRREGPPSVPTAPPPPRGADPSGWGVPCAPRGPSSPQTRHAPLAPAPTRLERAPAQVQVPGQAPGVGSEWIT